MALDGIEKRERNEQLTGKERDRGVLNSSRTIAGSGRNGCLACVWGGGG